MDNVRVELDSSRYPQSFVQKESQIKYENLFGKQMWKFIRLGKYLGYRSSLGAYSQIDNVILNNNLGLNLYVVSTVYYIVVILYS